MCNKKFIFVIQIIAVLICAGAFGQVSGPSSSDNDWNTYESNYFIIYYHSSANLKIIEDQLQQRTLSFDQTVQYGETTAEQRIGMRLDKLFNRVKEVLNMYPSVPRINIKIFKDRTELTEEYFKIFGIEIKDSRSFYIYKYDTIYTSETDIDDSIIIHEMAHVIIDHYFMVNMPEKVGEILASYVDAHLEN